MLHLKGKRHFSCFRSLSPTVFCSDIGALIINHIISECVECFEHQWFGFQAITEFLGYLKYESKCTCIVTCHHCICVCTIRATGNPNLNTLSTCTKKKI